MAVQSDGTTGIDKVQDGSIVDADVVSLTASKLTGALPAIDGSALTGIVTGEISASSYTTNGYVKTNDGLIIQWGTSPSVATNGSQTVTLPTTFPTAGLAGFCTIKQDNDASTGAYEVGFVSTTQIKIWAGATGGYPVFWLAIGY